MPTRAQAAKKRKGSVGSGRAAEADLKKGIAKFKKWQADTNPMQPPKTGRRVEATFTTNEEIAKKLGRPAARRTGHAPKRGKLNLKAKQKSMH